MNASQMRLELSKMYRGESWQNKVAKMSDAQVTAIYLSKLKKGK